MYVQRGVGPGRIARVRLSKTGKTIHVHAKHATR